MNLADGFDSKYRYILVAARRARQLQNGAPPVVEPHSAKACRIAEQEINAGKVKWEMSKTPAQVASELLSKSVSGESDE